MRLRKSSKSIASNMFFFFLIWEKKMFKPVFDLVSES